MYWKSIKETADFSLLYPYHVLPFSVKTFSRHRPRVRFINIVLCRVKKLQCNYSLHILLIYSIFLRWIICGTEKRVVRLSGIANFESYVTVRRASCHIYGLRVPCKVIWLIKHFYSCYIILTLLRVNWIIYVHTWM